MYLDMEKKIYVTTMTGYCGGTVVLSALCKTLRELGYDTELLIVPYFPNRRISTEKYKRRCILNSCKIILKLCVKKIISCICPNASFTKRYKSAASILKVEGIKIKWFPFFNGDNSIVLYSEDIYGNPLNAKNVVRWLLYYYDYTNDLNAYSSNDLFIAYRGVFNNEQLNPNNYIVTISYFNNRLYRQYNFKERTGKCYVIHKGVNRPDLPKVFDGPVFNSSQEDLVDMLNNHKYCYCYDPQTFYMTIAAVCGCIPVLVMEDGKTEKDYLSNSKHHYGIAYGDTPEQIQYAIETRDLLLKRLDYSSSNIKNAKFLVSILEEKFGKIRKLYK